MQKAVLYIEEVDGDFAFKKVDWRAFIYKEVSGTFKFVGTRRPEGQEFSSKYHDVDISFKTKEGLISYLNFAFDSYNGINITMYLMNPASVDAGKFSEMYQNRKRMEDLFGYDNKKHSKEDFSSLVTLIEEIVF